MNGKKGTKTIVAQITDMLAVLDDETYARPLDVLNGSTLGQHFRHILNFYECLFEGAAQGVIDYSARRRQPKVECDTCFALEAFTHIAASVDTLNEEANIRVKADFSADQKDARPIVQSSIGRELLFAYDHAVHHLAIIRIGIQTACPDVLLPASVGVAPATVKYHQKQN
jgi:hypothetical protein